MIRAVEFCVELLVIFVLCQFFCTVDHRHLFLQQFTLYYLLQCELLLQKQVPVV